MKKIFLIFIPFLAFCLIYTSINYSNIYLNKNHQYINLYDVDDFSGLDILKPTLENKKLVIVGEIHAKNKDDLFKLKMIKFLQKEENLKYYIAEIGYSDAYFINKYLSTGNEDILKNIFLNFKGTPAYNIDDYNFYKQLYEFNKTLNTKDKIKVIGIDIEYSFLNAYEYINEISNQKSHEIDTLQLFLVTLKQNNNTDINIHSRMYALKDSISKLLEDININPNKYKDLFGSHFDDFKYVIKNIECVYYDYLDSNDFETRESKIYENFLKLTKPINSELFFAQYGGYHIYQEKFTTPSDTVLDTFISKLNRDAAYKDSILSIQSTYYPEEVILKNDLPTKQANLFNKFFNTTNDSVLFKLNSKFTPFKYQRSLDSNKDSNSLDKYYQYLLILNNVSDSKQLDLK